MTAMRLWERRVNLDNKKYFEKLLTKNRNCDTLKTGIQKGEICVSK